MDSNFWKPFLTLFGIGAAISLARSLRSKKSASEIISECIISGFLSVSASLIMLAYPQAPFLVIVGGAAILAVLGVSFVSDKLESVIEKYLPKKE